MEAYYKLQQKNEGHDDSLSGLYVRSVIKCYSADYERIIPILRTYSSHRFVDMKELLIWLIFLN